MHERDNWFTTIYRSIISEHVRRKYSEMMYERKMNKKTREELERKSFGKLNKDKIFYVIRTDNTQHWGIFTTYLFVLSNVKYAVERGWIPVVDYKNYYLINLQMGDKRGKENAWNYYFEDLVPEYSLEEVYKSRNVILGPLRGQPYGSISWHGVAVEDLYNPEYDIYFRLAAKYLRVNSSILEETELLYRELFPKNERVLAVGIRAEAYWGSVTGHEAWKNHPKGIPVEQCIEGIKKCIEQYDYKFFYLSCEDEYYVNTIKKEFGDRCLYMDRSRAHWFDKGGNANELEEAVCYVSQRKNIEYVKDYLKEILLLTRCPAILKTMGSGYTSAFLLKQEKYEFVEGM